MPASQQSRRIITYALLVQLVLEVIGITASRIIAPLFGYAFLSAINQGLRIVNPVCNVVIAFGFHSLFTQEHQPADRVVAAAYILSLITQFFPLTSPFAVVVFGIVSRIGILALAWRQQKTRRSYALPLATCFVIESLARALFFYIIYTGNLMSLVSMANGLWNCSALVASAVAYLAMRRELNLTPAAAFAPTTTVPPVKRQTPPVTRQAPPVTRQTPQVTRQTPQVTQQPNTFDDEAVRRMKEKTGAKPQVQATAAVPPAAPSAPERDGGMDAESKLTKKKL